MSMLIGTRRALLNRAVVADSWWLSGGISAANAVAAYAAKGAASLVASYVNLANPGTFDVVPAVAPTWDATNGWIFAGAAYLLSGVAPTGSYTLIFRFSGAGNNGYAMNAQVSAGGGFFGIAPRRGGSSDIRYVWGASSIDTLPAITGGVLALAGANAYRDGASDGTVSGSFSGTPPGVAIGCRNTSGVFDSFFAGNVQAAAIYNVVLTSGQVAAVTTAMNAL